MRSMFLISALAVGGTVLFSGFASAQEPEAEPAAGGEAAPEAEPAATESEPPPAAGGAETASGSFSASTSEGFSSSGDVEQTPGLFEVGIFLGVLIPSKNHNLHDESRTRLEYKRIAPDIGLRLGYLPTTFAGVEVEGALMPTKTSDDASATLNAIRGHLILQYPTKPVVPFFVAGAGRLAVSSDSNGDDADPALHLGVGAKFPLGRLWGLRVDVRDNIATKNQDREAFVHHPEALLSLTATFGRPPAKEAPGDRDGDGFLDPADDCPDVPGVAPRGCPIPDTDGDGFLDPDDKCPTVAGIAPDGCPDPDPDKDGILNPEDQCPDVPGVAPDGCPDKDPDKDGILDPTDKCPTEPETKNGYEDADGCPDEVPEEVKKFTGVIAGIEFDTGKSTIRAKSKPTLDGAVKVLTDFPSLRVEISGHTDDRDTDEFNQKLSQARADAVKAYLVSKGIAEDRIKTRGAGESEPIADNKTAAGRQKNRRIEFKLLQE